MNKKLTLKLLVCLLMTAQISSCGSKPKSSNDPNWLFMQSATGGIFKNGQLTLSNIKQTIAFSDRPERKVIHLKNSDFAKSWGMGSDSFIKDPPNASMSYQVGGKTHSMVVELRSIKVFPNKIIYEVKVLDGNPPSKPFGFASLFIDSAGSAPGLFTQVVNTGKQD